MKIVLSDNTNVFMEPIYKKSNRLFGIPSKRFLNKTIKFLRITMPNFALFWQIADFIKILEKVFFYNNSISNSMYSSLNYADCENGFKFKNDDVSITVKLYEDSEKIAIDIHRLKGNELKSSMIFDSKKNTKLSKIDSALLESTINCILEECIYLMKYYYKMKGLNENGKQE